MNVKNKEPEHLKKAKAFHRLIQEEWQREAEGEVWTERGTLKKNGSIGRYDIYIKKSAPSDPITIVEINATDWEKKAKHSIGQNVKRIVKKMNSLVKKGDDICHGIIFPNRPTDKNKMELIERLFEEEGITVVWHDKTVSGS